MNNKLKIGIGLIFVAIGLFILPLVMAQQPNEYRAYVSGQFVDPSRLHSGSNVTIGMNVAYLPVYPSETYTFTADSLFTLIDMSQPTKINDQIAAAIKQQGASKGYSIVRVFVPSYEQKIP